MKRRAGTVLDEQIFQALKILVAQNLHALQNHRGSPVCVSEKEDTLKALPDLVQGILAEEDFVASRTFATGAFQNPRGNAPHSRYPVPKNQPQGAAGLH